MPDNNFISSKTELIVCGITGPAVCLALLTAVAIYVHKKVSGKCNHGQVIVAICGAGIIYCKNIKL